MHFIHSFPKNENLDKHIYAAVLIDSCNLHDSPSVAADSADTHTLVGKWWNEASFGFVDWGFFAVADINWWSPTLDFDISILLIPIDAAMLLSLADASLDQLPHLEVCLQVTLNPATPWNYTRSNSDGELAAISSIGLGCLYTKSLCCFVESNDRGSGDRWETPGQLYPWGDGCTGGEILWLRLGGSAHASDA